MLILGINDGHCSSACLLSDDKILAWVQEERFTRKKNYIDFPLKSIKYCLEFAGVEGKDLDAVAISTVSFDPNIYRIKRESNFSVEDWIREQEEYWRPRFYENRSADNFYIDLAKEEKFAGLTTYYPIEEIDSSLTVSERSKKFGEIRRKYAASVLSIDYEKVKLIDHQTAHAMYAYYASPIMDKKVAILTNDGGGDGANGTLWIKEPGFPIKEINRNNCSNLGRIYRYITLILGMKIGEHEFKVMGLAPYATGLEVEKSWPVFKDLFKTKESLIVPNQKPKELYYHFKNALTGHRFDGIAGAVQRMVENVTCDWFGEVAKNYGVSNFTYSGGVAMNVKLNGLLTSQQFVGSLYVPPSGGDESLSLGAAYALMERYFWENGKDFDSIPSIESIYLGPDNNSEELKKECAKLANDDLFKIMDNANPQYIAKLLSEGKVIGRCSGRMEFGQRSLCNRSIFADPRSVDVVDKINTKIKYRDFWMPFAPVVLDSEFTNYFKTPSVSDARFMMLGLHSTSMGKKLIPGGLHPSDKTGRPQVLTRDQNQDVYAMLKEFKSLTGVGSVINTSLNLHGEPIVCGPKDSIHTLKNSALDGVWMDNQLVLREKV